MHLAENSIQNLIADPYTRDITGKSATKLAELVTARFNTIRYDLSSLNIPNLKEHAKANDIPIRKGAPKDEILDLLATTHASHEGYAVALRALTAQIAAAETEAHTENDRRDAEKDAHIAALAAESAQAAFDEDMWEAHTEAIEIDYHRDMDAARAARMTYAEIKDAGAVGFSNDPAISDTRSRRIGDRGAMFELLHRGAQYWLVMSRWEGVRLLGCDIRTYDADRGADFLADLLDWQSSAVAEIVSDYQANHQDDAAIAPGARVRVNTGDHERGHGKQGIVTIVVDDDDIRVDYEDGTWAEVPDYVIEVL